MISCLLHQFLPRRFLMGAALLHASTGKLHALPAHQIANLVEGGDTPILPPERLEAIGFKIAAYPLTLLSAATRAMSEALEALRRGETPEGLLPFETLRELVGFDAYDRERTRYSDDG